MLRLLQFFYRSLSRGFLFYFRLLSFNGSYFSHSEDIQRQNQSKNWFFFIWKALESFFIFIFYELSIYLNNEVSGGVKWTSSRFVLFHCVVFLRVQTIAIIRCLIKYVNIGRKLKKKHANNGLGYILLFANLLHESLEYKICYGWKRMGRSQQFCVKTFDTKSKGQKKHNSKQSKMSEKKFP